MFYYMKLPCVSTTCEEVVKKIITFLHITKLHQLFLSISMVTCRPLSRASSTISKAPPPTQDVTASGYVIPHFDFDEPELHEGPADVDEVNYKLFIYFAIASLYPN